MERSDGESFTSLVNAVFETYARPQPSKAAKLIWWETLSASPFPAVRAAMLHFAATETRFPPTPAQIREMLGHGKNDGRPAADEAWATALRAQDEAETVVWTEETAQAFAVCRTVLERGDEVGARMAFKAAYDRAVNTARMGNEKAKWVASVGFDAERRSAALMVAQKAGLLPAPQVQTLLPAPEHVVSPMDEELARENVAKLRKMLGEAMSARRLEKRRAARGLIEREAGLKAQAAEKAAGYLAGEEVNRSEDLQ